MSIISLVAALDETGGLGYNNQLLCHLPSDLHHFKTITMGKPIIMGRKTFESIGKPLPGRTNLVISRTLLAIEGVRLCRSLEEAISQAMKDSEIMIIGGAEIFFETINKADRLYITRIHHEFIADVFFPPIDESKWSCRKEEFIQQDEKNKYDMTFYIYERIGIDLKDKKEIKKKAKSN